MRSDIEWFQKQSQELKKVLELLQISMKILNELVHFNPENQEIDSSKNTKRSWQSIEAKNKPPVQPKQVKEGNSRRNQQVGRLLQISN